MTGIASKLKLAGYATHQVRGKNQGILSSFFFFQSSFFRVSFFFSRRRPLRAGRPPAPPQVGKWDAGMATPDHTPRGRGYHSALNYFHHCNDYWSMADASFSSV